MTKTTALRALFAGAGVAAAGVMGMAVASADDGAQQANLGGAAQIDEGGTVQEWTVGALRPSGDTIGYAPNGTLWEATATNTNVAGGNIPFIPAFSAAGGDGNFPVLWNVATPEGVNPGGLAPGQSVTGKLYFDVPAGTAPDRVMFGDQAVWVTPPPPAAPAYTPSQGGSYSPAYVPPANSYAAQAAPAAVAPSAPAPVAPPVTGSRGTPSAAPAATPSAPAAGSTGTPLSAAATPAPAAATPAPASSAPASAAAPATATPAPAVSGGSQGTPITAPTTTVVPVPGS